MALVPLAAGDMIDNYFSMDNEDRWLSARCKYFNKTFDILVKHFD